MVSYINKIHFEVRTQKMIFRKMLQSFCLFRLKFGGIKNKMLTDFIFGWTIPLKVKSVKPAYNHCFKNSEVDI